MILGRSKQPRFWVKGHCSRIVLTFLILLTIVTVIFFSHMHRHSVVTTQNLCKKYQASRLDINSATKSPRIMCIILTTQDRKTQSNAVNCTWVKRCDKHLFVMSEMQNSTISRHADIVRNTSDILVLNKPEGREHLTFKVRTALNYVHDFYLNSFDWVLKADDDTYVIMENLHNLLSHYDSEKPGYIGHLFKVLVPNGYMSGGSGYAISNCGLRQLITRGFRDNACKSDGVFEDAKIGKCLQISGVRRLSSVDDKGRQSFIPERIGNYYPWNSPAWLQDSSWIYPQKGYNCCSQYIVSFHRVNERDVYLLEHILHNTQVFGRTQSNPKWQIGVVPDTYWNMLTRFISNDKE